MCVSEGLNCEIEQVSRLQNVSNASNELNRTKADFCATEGLKPGAKEVKLKSDDSHKSKEFILPKDTDLCAGAGLNKALQIPQNYKLKNVKDNLCAGEVLDSKIYHIQDLCAQEGLNGHNSVNNNVFSANKGLSGIKKSVDKDSFVRVKTDIEDGRSIDERFYASKGLNSGTVTCNSGDKIWCNSEKSEIGQIIRFKAQPYEGLDSTDEVFKKINFINLLEDTSCKESISQETIKDAANKGKELTLAENGRYMDEKWSKNEISYIPKQAKISKTSSEAYNPKEKYSNEDWLKRNYKEQTSRQSECSKTPKTSKKYMENLPRSKSNLEQNDWLKKSYKKYRTSKKEDIIDGVKKRIEATVDDWLQKNIEETKSIKIEEKSEEIPRLHRTLKREDYKISRDRIFEEKATKNKEENIILEKDTDRKLLKRIDGDGTCQEIKNELEENKHIFPETISSKTNLFGAKLRHSIRKVEGSECTKTESNLSSKKVEYFLNTLEGSTSKKPCPDLANILNVPVHKSDLKLSSKPTNMIQKSSLEHQKQLSKSDIKNSSISSNSLSILNAQSLKNNYYEKLRLENGSFGPIFEDNKYNYSVRNIPGNMAQASAAAAFFAR